MAKPGTRPAAKDDPEAWAALERELDRWRAADRVARLWWRDDDAVGDTPALRRLLDLADQTGAELALAVIPARADSGLARALRDRSRIAVLQHGYAHRNHAGPDAKKSEYPAHRSPAEVRREWTHGQRRLRALVGDQAVPVLVPPWNRIAEALVPAVVPAGFCGLSTHGDTAGDPATPQVNTQIDIIDWPAHRAGGASLADPARLLSALADGLAARRAERVPADRPLGLLTHHLEHDAACWDFLDALVARLAGHQGASFEPVRALFPERPSEAVA